MPIKKLIELQEIDQHIQQLNIQLADIPKQLSKHRPKLDSAIQDEKTLHKQIEETTKKRHALELELKTREEEVKKLSSQLNLVKTNEQYTAMQHEITAAQKAISQHEDKILEMMVFIDKAKDESALCKSKVQKEQTVYNEAESKLNEEKKRLEGLIQQAEIRRSACLQQIEPDILKIYQRIAGKHGGVAITSLKDDICQGCFMKLPHQIEMEVRSSKKLVYCENCSRILYIIESESPEERG